MDHFQSFSEVTTSVTCKPNIHHRRSIRLKGHGYSLPYAYFVTICTMGNICVFGDDVDKVMILNPTGMLVQSEWCKLVEKFPYLVLDSYVVMPNHPHGIIAHVWTENTFSDNQDTTLNDVCENAKIYDIGNQGAMNCAPTNAFSSITNVVVRSGVCDPTTGKGWE